jgi:4-hydroxybenzoate polyprenyltransferase
VTTIDTDRSIIAVRLLRFCAERFPPVASALTAVLIAGTCDLVAQAAAGGAVVVDALSLALAFLVLAVLYVIRVQDEHKDLETDRVVHPDRPLVRGLVSARELAFSALLVGGASVAALALLSPWAAAGAVAVFGYVALMWREMFLGAHLRERPLAYLVSHQLVVPLLAAAVAFGRGTAPVLEVALVAASALGCAWAFEVGRKIRAPEDEREGEETWSKVFGPRGAALVGALGVIGAGGAAVVLGLRLELGLVATSVIGGLSLLTALPFLAFAKAPSSKGASGLMGAGAGLSLVIYGGLITALVVSYDVVFFGGAA